MNSWINEAVFYHIYPLGFTGSPQYNDGKQEYRLDKIKEWIPHMREMNITALYLGPVFDSSKHGYDTKDYYKVDTRLGDNDSFKEICKQLHENGIRIVLDGVLIMSAESSGRLRMFRKRAAQASIAHGFII